MVSAVRPIRSTVRLYQREGTRLNNINTHYKVKATLLNLTDTHHMAKATPNNNPTARHHPYALLHPTAHHLQCPRDGFSNGIRAASAGITSSRRLAVHSGTLPLIYHQVRTPRHQLARHM
jgi:hypothetical protein